MFVSSARRSIAIGVAMVLAVLVAAPLPAVAATRAIGANCEVRLDDKEPTHTTITFRYLGDPPRTARAGVPLVLTGVRFKVTFDDWSAVAPLISPAKASLMGLVQAGWLDVTVNGHDEGPSNAIGGSSELMSANEMAAKGFETKATSVVISDVAHARAGTWAFANWGDLWFSLFNQDGGQPRFHCVPRPGQNQYYGTTLVG